MPAKKLCEKTYIFFTTKNSLLFPLALNISSLKGILCIYYLLCFKKDLVKIYVPLNFTIEVNIIAPIYMASLCLKIRLTNIRAQKIDSFTLLMFSMALISITTNNKLGQSQCFQKLFLMANIGVKLILSMVFLIFSNIIIRFAKKKIT